jgi:hypothetical protein
MNVEIESNPPTNSLGARRRWFGYHPQSVPLMSRLAYHRELFSSALLPVMLTALQGGTMAVIVKKMFTDVPEISTYQLNTAVGLVAASRSIGHLTSLLWASYSRGKPKVRFIQRLQLLTASIVAAMAFASHSAAGLWYFTTLCISGWIAWSGVVTLRAGVWRANYHHTHRATIAGKISTLRALILAIMGITVGLCLDAGQLPISLSDDCAIRCGGCDGLWPITFSASESAIGAGACDSCQHEQL